MSLRLPTDDSLRPDCYFDPFSMDDGQASEYVLYYFRYSVCSLMVFYTLALRGKPKEAKDEINVQTRAVDLFHEEQFEENFLCNINNHGQVRHTSPGEKPVADTTPGPGTCT